MKKSITFLLIGVLVTLLGIPFLPMSTTAGVIISGIGLLLCLYSIFLAINIKD